MKNIKELAFLLCFVTFIFALVTVENWFGKFIKMIINLRFKSRQKN